MKTFSFILASMLIAPCYAGELDNIGPSTQLYVRIPLGASAPKERVPSYGLTIRGRQEYQVFTLDSRTLDAISAMPYDGGLFAGLELKWLLVGGAVAVGAVAVAAKGGGGPTGGPTKQGTPPPPQQDVQTTQAPTQGTQPPPPPQPCPASCPPRASFF
jgi:hypothetical protein